MATFMYVDYSNLRVAAKKIATYKAGLIRSYSADIAASVVLCPWTCEFSNLYVASKRALIVTSEPFNCWGPAKKAGFEVKVLPKNSFGREKGVDTTLVVEIMKDAFLHMNTDTDNVIIVSGDADLTPAVKFLTDNGMDTTVAFWHAEESHQSLDIRNAATRFFSLMPYWDSLTFKHDNMTQHFKQSAKTIR